MQATYLSTRQAAEYTGISESYLTKLRMDDSPVKGPPYLRVGLRMIKYRREDLDSWLATRAVCGSEQEAQ